MGGRGETGGQAELVRGVGALVRDTGSMLQRTEEVMGLKGTFVGWVIGKFPRKMATLKERRNARSPVPNCTVRGKLTDDGKEEGSGAEPSDTRVSQKSRCWGTEKKRTDPRHEG